MYAASLQAPPAALLTVQSALQGREGGAALSLHHMFSYHMPSQSSSIAKATSSFPSVELLQQLAA